MLFFVGDLLLNHKTAFWVHLDEIRMEGRIKVKRKITGVRHRVGLETCKRANDTNHNPR